jgi:hypothetical protein
LARREALSLGYDQIDTEHILLGLVRENEGVGAQILLAFDADLDTIRNEANRALSTTERQRSDRDKAAPAIEPPQEMRTFLVTFHLGGPDGTHGSLGLKVHAESPEAAIEMDYRGHVPDRYLAPEIRRTAEQIPHEEWRV